MRARHDPVAITCPGTLHTQASARVTTQRALACRRRQPRNTGTGALTCVRASAWYIHFLKTRSSPSHTPHHRSSLPPARPSPEAVAATQLSLFPTEPVRRGAHTRANRRSTAATPRTQRRPSQGLPAAWDAAAQTTAPRGCRYPTAHCTAMTNVCCVWPRAPTPVHRGGGRSRPKGAEPMELSSRRSPGSCHQCACGGPPRGP